MLYYSCTQIQLRFWRPPYNWYKQPNRVQSDTSHSLHIKNPEQTKLNHHSSLGVGVQVMVISLPAVEDRTVECFGWASGGFLIHVSITLELITAALPLQRQKNIVSIVCSSRAELHLPSPVFVNMVEFRLLVH